MPGWKDLFTLTRHQRQGALVLLAFIAFTLLTLWVARLTAPPGEPADVAAVQRFEASIDSLEAAQAHRDSLKPSARNHRKHHSARRSNDDKDNKPAGSKKSGKRKGTPRPPTPQRPLDPMPHIPGD